MSQKAGESPESGIQAGPATFVALGLIAVCALIRPGFVLHTQHVDERYAEEPLSTLLLLGAIVPLVIVPAAILALLVMRIWTRAEMFALALLLVGWLVPLVVASLSFGCSDVGGVAEPCGVTEVSTPRQIVVLACAAAVVSIAAWLAASPRRRPPRPLHA